MPYPSSDFNKPTYPLLYATCKSGKYKPKLGKYKVDFDWQTAVILD